MAKPRKEDYEPVLASDIKIGLAKTAAALGITRTYLLDWVANGAPAIQKASGNKPYVFSVSSVNAWREYIAGNGSGTKGTTQDEKTEIRDLKLRRMRADTIAAETLAAERLGELVEIDAVMDEFTRAVTAFKQKLVAIPAKHAKKLAPKLPPGQVQKILTGAINEALKEIAKYDGSDTD